MALHGPYMGRADRNKGGTAHADVMVSELSEQTPYNYNPSTKYYISLNHFKRTRIQEKEKYSFVKTTSQIHETSNLWIFLKTSF